ncbi:MAG: hypothetical protein EOO20_08575 [Chryseobacterium sp.]|nr:MAG: hypothetical protein EOO20_08575 [Chryseobacterium sp.]
MAKTNNSSTPAQGGGSDLFDHVVTQADLDANKELINAGVKVGDTIQVPKQDDAKGVLLEAKQPEWVEKLLVLVGQLKDEVSELKTSLAKSAKEATPNAVVDPVQLIDENEEYEVAPGKSFRDPLDFTKEYAEGDDVTHLGVIKLQALLNSDLIVESE